MAEKPLKLSMDVKRVILQKVKRYWEDFEEVSWRERLKYNDLVYLRELSQYYLASKKLHDDRLRSTNMQPIEIPVVQPQVDTLVAQLTNIFLQGTPLFAYVSGPENQDSVSALNALQRKHETLSRRSRELLLYLKDVCKYNYAAAECDWVTSQQANYSNNIKNVEYAAVTQSDVSYTKIERLDLYNCFFDNTCQFSELPYYGEFFGFHKLMSHIELRQRLLKLPSEATSSFKESFESGFDPSLYYVPDLIHSIKDLRLREFNWFDHFGIVNPGAKIKYSSRYVLSTCYFRASAKDLGIAATDQNAIRIFKALVVNMKEIVYVEEITAAHSMLPIATSRLVDDGLRDQTKSIVESLEPVQTLTTQLHTARIADLARAISDRAVFDPCLIDARKVNDPSPTAKIPIKPFGQGKGLLSQAYYPIPYRNDAAASLISESQLMMRVGEEIAGLNPVQRGSFVKGNKTLGEFQTVMGNAEDRAIVYAILLDAQGFFVMKEISKSNILQYQGPTKVFDSQQKKVLELDPSNLRQLIFEFDVADGLQPVSKFTSPEVLTAALQFVSASPQLQAEYDLTSLFSYIFNTRGTIDLNSFRRRDTFVQPAAPQQQQVAPAAQGVPPQ